MADVRVQRELTKFLTENVPGITISILEPNNIRRLSATIAGPPSTPYEGGTFYINIELADGYPYSPPKMQFITKVWHPNISSQTGAICLDILKDQWSPVYGIKTALLSLQALLSAPEPKDPQDAVVAEQYIKNYQAFVTTARDWTQIYAKASSSSQSHGTTDKAKKLVDMGFSERLVRKALEAAGGDEKSALEMLCAR